MAIKAALDIGSNSIKLLVLVVASDGSYEILHDEYMVTGLGSGLVAGANLQPEAVEKSLLCIAKMVATAKAHGAGEVVAAGTAALRKAADSVEFAAQVWEQTGIRLQVISAEDEARLSRVVALAELQTTAGQVVFFDIGGGSTELTWCEGNAAARTVLMPMGARQLTEVAQISHPVDQEMQDRLAAYIGLQFSKHEVTPAGPIVESDFSPTRPSYQLAGLGGTAVTLTRLLNLEIAGGEPSSHNVKVRAARIAELLDQLRQMAIGEVEAWLDPDAARAPVIFAGAFLLNELLIRFGVEDFQLVDRGLRFGLLLGD